MPIVLNVLNELTGVILYLTRPIGSLISGTLITNPLNDLRLSKESSVETSAPLVELTRFRNRCRSNPLQLMFVYGSGKADIVYHFHYNGAISSEKVIDQRTCFTDQFMAKHILKNDCFNIENGLSFTIEHNLTTWSW